MTSGKAVSNCALHNEVRTDIMLLNFAILLVAGLAGVKGECRRHGVPCLEYTVLQTHEGYEEREYPSIVWVSASAESSRKMDVSRSLIKQLYAYLGGANDREEKLQMVVPVRTKKVINGDRNVYTIAIALTAEQGANAPKPSNPNVTVTREPKRIYVTRAFDGQARQDEIWDKHAENLRNSASNDESVDTSFYYMSVYDSPWRETDRLNEVWMLKREN